MKAVTIYEAHDGARFNSMLKCQAYEVLLVDLAEALTHLPPLPPEIDFSNGRGYIQHEASTLLTFDIFFSALIGKHFGVDCADRYRAQPKGFVWRLLSDTHDPEHNAICKAGYRRQCIDDQWREWGQMYFVLNPTEGKNVRLNP